MTPEQLEEASKRRKHTEGTVHFLKHRIDEKQAREEYGLTEDEIWIFSQVRGREKRVFDAGLQEKIVEMFNRKTCPRCGSDDKNKRLCDCTHYWHDPPL